jgi:hypothetical protein
MLVLVDCCCGVLLPVESPCHRGIKEDQQYGCWFNAVNAQSTVQFLHFFDLLATVLSSQNISNFSNRNLLAASLYIYDIYVESDYF